MKYIIFCTIFVINSLSAYAQGFSWPFLDTEAIGAKEFIAQNPEYDGRGILIFVLDNGVDPSIPGLDYTSSEKTKVIEMRDFTGQVTIKLSEAEYDTLNSKVLLKSNGIRIEGWQNLELKPADGKYYTGKMEEAAYKNSAVSDINYNGSNDDVFAVLAYPVENGLRLLNNAPGFIKPAAGERVWVYYIDEDNDGHIDDEVPKYDYKYKFDTFDFHKGQKEVRPLLTFAANVHPESKTLEIVTTDGSHGTHCAGIAAGNNINSAEGNDGIAPGAYVANLKIGSNVLSGGATVASSMKKAYEYAAKFMKEAGFEYAVVSMSYGIGNEEPGKSEIELFLNDFYRQNPGLVIVTSNGNNGPGINSTGNPSAAYGVISAGAMIPPQTLRDLYGSSRKTNWITHFSSRGGETAKPDVIAPGAAASTVPVFQKGDAFWGTSMACPQVAGASALLLSAAKADSINVTNFMVKKALKFTAKPLQGYTHIDYGSGLVDIPKAYEYLKLLADRGDRESPAYYEMQTGNTFYRDISGPAAFWKSNGYFPEEGDKQNVTIQAVFPDHMREEERAKFYRAFSLRSDADWLSADKSSIYIRSDQPASIGLLYDHSKMKKPGIYTGRIYAYTEDVKNGGNPDFDVQAAVVIPYEFTKENNFSRKFENGKLETGDIQRNFVQIPPGASSMNVSLDPSDDKWFEMGLYIYTPDGNRAYSSFATDNKERKGISFHIPGNDLPEGIWEVIPYCYYQSRNVSHYDLEIKFYGVASEPETISNIKNPVGELPHVNCDVTNVYNELLSTGLTGVISGYCMENEYSQSGKQKFSRKIKSAQNIKSVDFYIEMPVEEYNKMTDLAVNIYNTDGKAVYSTGMSRKYKKFTFNPTAAGEYTLEIVPAFTSEEILAEEWIFTVKERYNYINSIYLKPENSSEMLYPGVPKSLKFTATDPLPMPPEGTSACGKVVMTDKKNGNLIKEIPVLLK